MFGMFKTELIYMRINMEQALACTPGILLQHLMSSYHRNKCALQKNEILNTHEKSHKIEIINEIFNTNSPSVKKHL